MGLYQELLKKKIILQTDDDTIVVNNELPDKTKPLSSSTNNQNSQRANSTRISQEILSPSAGKPLSSLINVNMLHKYGNNKNQENRVNRIREYRFNK